MPRVSIPSTSDVYTVHICQLNSCELHYKHYIPSCHRDVCALLLQQSIWDLIVRNRLALFFYFSLFFCCCWFAASPFFWSCFDFLFHHFFSFLFFISLLLLLLLQKWIQHTYSDIMRYNDYYYVMVVANFQRFWLSVCVSIHFSWFLLNILLEARLQVDSHWKCHFREAEGLLFVLNVRAIYRSGGFSFMLAACMHSPEQNQDTFTNRVISNNWRTPAPNWILTSKVHK